MRIRRPDRVLAGLLLIAFAATLALLAQPSSASSLDGYDIRASVRYGCAQTDGADSFVEVKLSAEHWKGDDRELMLQVGLAGPDSADADGVFPEGGPSLVTLGETPVRVRLAGPVHDGDHVFLRQLNQSEVITLPLEGDCRRIKPTNFGLDEPGLQVAAQYCTSGSRANLKVTLDNPNDVDPRLENMGIDQINYTVLLVRQDGLLAGTEPVGTLISFDERSASVITLSQVVAQPARYQVRVIGLDGAVVSSGNIRLSCAGTVPPSSSSPTRPTPTVPTSRPGTTTPSTSAPAPSSPAPSTPVPSSPAPSSPAPSRTVSSSAPASSPPAGSAPASSAPAAPGGSAVRTPPASSAVSSSNPQAVPTPRSSTPDRTPSSPAGTSSAAVPTAASPAPSPTPSSIRLVEPRPDYGALPVFQKEVALVVLVFSVAMAALVGGTVVAARRR